VPKPNARAAFVVGVKDLASILRAWVGVKDLASILRAWVDRVCGGGVTDLAVAGLGVMGLFGDTGLSKFRG